MVLKEYRCESYGILKHPNPRYTSLEANTIIDQIGWGIFIIQTSVDKLAIKFKFK